ncbi:hypothetical protein [Edaphobacter albus]|uniref:hypothetical protein n=1 Tax=Edaphobacter sp. 4G125 TaxID=2763071 RepID=UPI001647FFDD|nr:hypothetical protein [Edaphobacter sp. 4G125]QNI35363.1 hypothetical protein H7846_09670 [Edaphobacter sp. 4G125]
MKSKCLALFLLGALPSALYADFSYTETTQITGGAMLNMMKTVSVFSKQARQIGEPIVSTVSIQGNRMVRSNSMRTEIVDLNAETITTIDHAKKQYTTMTFEQMRQQMNEAMKKGKEQRETGTQPSDTDLSFQVKVRNTGATKDVAGVNTSEAILNMTMDATDKKSGQTGSLAITNDMWLAPEVPGYDEVREFQRRFALKLGTVFSESFNPTMFASQPGAGKALADMVKEMSKLKGIPLLQVMRMGTTANGDPLPAASEAPLPQSNSPAMPSAGQVAKDSATSAITSSLGLGGLGGFGRKKKAADPAPAADASASQGPAVLVESNTQMSDFSQSAVDASKFAIPAGYKQIEPKIANP